VEKIFHGESKEGSKLSGSKLNNKELIARARKRGFITPRKY